MNVSLVSSDTARIEASVLGQLAYHIRFAAVLAADGRGEESVPHAVLAWALLRSIGGEALREAVAELDLPDEFGDVHPIGAHNVRESTEELALQLCSHFTSVGHHGLAQLYLGAYQLLVSED